MKRRCLRRCRPQLQPTASSEHVRRSWLSKGPSAPSAEDYHTCAYMCGADPDDAASLQRIEDNGAAGDGGRAPHRLPPHRIRCPIPISAPPICTRQCGPSSEANRSPARLRARGLELYRHDESRSATCLRRRHRPDAQFVVHPQLQRRGAKPPRQPTARLMHVEEISPFPPSAASKWRPWWYRPLSPRRATGHGGTTATYPPASPPCWSSRRRRSPPAARRWQDRTLHHSRRQISLRYNSGTP